MTNRRRPSAVTWLGVSGVNTVSRIEQPTKEYPFAALLSDDARRLLTVSADDLTFLGDVTIRGRATATALWGLGVP